MFQASRETLCSPSRDGKSTFVNRIECDSDEIAHRLHSERAY